MLAINSCWFEQLISETDGDKTAFTEECSNQNKAFHLFVPVWNLIVEFPNAFSNHHLFVLLLHESGWLLEFRDMEISVDAEGFETDVSCCGCIC